MTFSIPMPKPGGGYDRRLTVSGKTAQVLFPDFARGTGPYSRGGAAYDSLPRSLAYGGRRARDQEGPEGGEESDPRLKQVKQFLRNRLTPEDFDRLEQLMASLNGEGEEGESPFSAGGPREGEDDPSRFRGQPLVGGRMAGDSRGASYLDYFEMNAAVDINDYGGGRR